MTPDTLRVLLLAPQLPFPPEQGAALRNYNLLKYIGSRHRVTLVAFGRSRPVPPELSDCCEQVVTVAPPTRTGLQRLAGQIHPRPDLAIRLRSSAFAAAVAALCRRRTFDIVQCEALELYLYARAVPAPLVFDAHNAEWRLQQRAYQAALLDRRWAAAAYSLLQWRKLVGFEAAALCRAVRTLAVSASDRDDLHAIAPDVALTILPNGVDDDVYAPLPEACEDIDSILFAGKMDFRPNVEGAIWLASRVMPLVWACRPAARLTLFGRDPAPAVRRLAADPRIVVTGHVPGTQAEKLALARAAVVAVPLLSGGGTRLKVPTALAMARPLVSTPLGAAGYDLRSGKDLLLAGTAAEFAAALLRLLQDRTLAGQLGAQGRRAVQQRFTWQRLLPTLDRVYAEALDGRG
jgi:polysaccharide biosynthesis protein PslH